MIRGMYMGAMGMLNDMFKLDMIANNLANVDTAGYKRDRAAFKTYLEGMLVSILPSIYRGRKEVPIGKLEGAVVLDEVRPDLSQGSVVYTGNPYDLAISGSGFFAIEKNGQVLFTRAGNFKRDFAGYLVTNDGGYVLDEKGSKIKIEDGWKISDDGTIRDEKGKAVAKIAIYDFTNPEKLQKVGYTYFKQTKESGKPQKALSGIMVGYIEKSNVNALREMVNMIKALRHFEISQRTITTSDQLLDRLFNSVASLR